MACSIHVTFLLKHRNESILNCLQWCDCLARNKLVHQKFMSKFLHIIAGGYWRDISWGGNGENNVLGFYCTSFLMSYKHAVSRHEAQSGQILRWAETFNSRQWAVLRSELGEDFAFDFWKLFFGLFPVQ